MRNSKFNIGDAVQIVTEDGQINYKLPHTIEKTFKITEVLGENKLINKFVYRLNVDEGFTTIFEENLKKVSL